MMQFLKIILLPILLFTSTLFAQDFDRLAKEIIAHNLKGIDDLLENGADVNAREPSSSATVLMVACSYYGYDTEIEFLILNGADVNAVSNDGKTALMWAATTSPDYIQLLINNGADVNVVANDGMTAFLQSAFSVLSEKVSTEVCDHLLNAGADINAALKNSNTSGWSAIHLAAFEGDTEFVKYLITKGARVNSVSDDGSTPLSLAKLGNYDELIELLRKSGARD